MKKSCEFLIVFMISLTLLFSVIFVIPERENRVCFENKCFSVEIADTIEEMETGLMNRDYLPPGNGMLFVFSKSGKYSFWMKDTLISLDIIWINEKNEIVYIAKNQTPCGLKCSLINPNQMARYVLEINAGQAEEFDLKIWDKVEILI